MSPEAFRLLAALVGILLLVLLVARFKWHPFLALMFVSWGLAVTYGIDPVQAIAGFSKGFGDILSFVGIVIGLGTMIGGLLVSSGGADAFANAMISIGGRKYVPWTGESRGKGDRGRISEGQAGDASFGQPRRKRQPTRKLVKASLISWTSRDEALR